MSPIRPTAPLFRLQSAAPRPLLKTLTFALMHMAVAFTVVYLLTGDAVAGGVVALIEPSCNTVAYYLHERLWLRREAAAGQAAPPRREALPAAG